MCGGRGGHYLHQCVTVDVFVSAAMHHIQHMLPSSSPFRGRLSRDTQQDSLTWSRGTTWGRSPRGHGSLREFQHPGKWHEQISRFTWMIFQKEALFVFPNQHEEWMWLRASFHFWSSRKSGAAPSHVGPPLVEPWTSPSLAFVTDITCAWAKGLDQSGRHVRTLITNISINVLGPVSSGLFVPSFCLCSPLEHQGNTEWAPRMHHGVYQALILHF